MSCHFFPCLNAYKQKSCIQNLNKKHKREGERRKLHASYKHNLIRRQDQPKTNGCIQMLLYTAHYHMSIIYILLL